MSADPLAAAQVPERPGRSAGAGQSLDESRGRTFPCAACGGDLEFHIGKQSLTCPFCGAVQEVPLDETAAVREQDFAATLRRLVELREKKGAQDLPGDEILRCTSCAAEVLFTGTLTSSECAYCGAPVQRDQVHRTPDRVPVDGVLPFQVEHGKARERLRRWTKSRWFAPSEFKKRGVEGRFQGVYLPFWTFDSLTFNRYRGERGEHYYVTVGSGKNQRRERRTRWYPASGSFQRFFDDVLVPAVRGQTSRFLPSLEPWPLERLTPFQADFLAGFQARTYDLGLEGGFEDAKQRMEAALRAEVRQRIGGDEQRIHDLDTRCDAITYKHLLLPVWLLSYRYGSKTYQVVVNAVTGEVQGERPWSWIKITLAVLAALVVILVLAAS